MSLRVLVTGSAGLVGTALRQALAAVGFEAVGMDLRESDHRADVRDADAVARAMEGCGGVVHLAAVSRVIDGERDPERCRSTNVGGVKNVLGAARSSKLRPWVVFVSSREVYGEADSLPASEDAALRPMNVYGRTKVAGEELVGAARLDGLKACVVRLSNVFGSTLDHPDRVVPAFARGAVLGRTLRVDGEDHTFDFTHISDVSRGLAALALYLERESRPPPPIHFVTGTPTTLGELARLAIELGGNRSLMHLAPPRDFDVQRFFGDPARARSLLGWSPEVPLRQGLEALMSAYARELQPAEVAESTG
ncbi:MAG: NAD(P)-dependent oxidoreductase [Polyangiaceae bacterium]